MIKLMRPIDIRIGYIESHILYLEIESKIFPEYLKEIERLKELKIDLIREQKINDLLK